MKPLLATLILLSACVTAAPKAICSRPPTTVRFENRSVHGRAFTYAGRVHSLPPVGRVELLYSAATYQVEFGAPQPLPTGPYDEFGTLHVEVR